MLTAKETSLRIAAFADELQAKGLAESAAQVGLLASKLMLDVVEQKQARIPVTKLRLGMVLASIDIRKGFGKHKRPGTLIAIKDDGAFLQITARVPELEEAFTFRVAKTATAQVVQYQKPMQATALRQQALAKLRSVSAQLTGHELEPTLARIAYSIKHA